MTENEGLIEVYVGQNPGEAEVSSGGVDLTNGVSRLEILLDNDGTRTLRLDFNFFTFRGEFKLEDSMIVARVEEMTTNGSGEVMMPPHRDHMRGAP